MSKQVYIIGNWKSHKTQKEVETWFSDIASSLSVSVGQIKKNVTTILCIPYIHLARSYDLIQTYALPFSLASQNISPYGAGAYTGEIHAQQVREYAQYTLIGHSERRHYFSETTADIEKKIEQSMKHDLIPILCISETDTPIPDEVTMVAYEPISAIGTGHPMDPIEANRVADKIHTLRPSASVIYGGSVTSENIASFLSQPHISGVLPGGASLQASSFLSMIHHGCSI